MENGGAGTGVGGGAPGGPGDQGVGQGSATDGGGGESTSNYAEEVSNAISTDMSNAKSANPAQTARDKDPENFDPMGSSHIGQFGYYGGVDASGQPTGTQPTHSTMGHTLVGDAMRAKDQTITGIGINFTDAQYKDKGWVPGKALTYTDEDGKTQLARLDARDQSLSQSHYEKMRDQAYAAKAAQPGIDTPFGKITAETIGKMAFSAAGGAAVGIGSAFLGTISQEYDARVSGDAATRSALGYHGPGYPTGMPDIGPFMSDKNRNWDDARWADKYDPTSNPANPVHDFPTSPAGGEQITVATPAGTPDARVSQFKALYPEDWTATLTDEEIIEMVENPDQLRFWLSWRQT